jgi:hypothetical protein
VPPDCQTAYDDQEFIKIGDKIVTDINKTVNASEANSKTIHLKMINSIKEQVNDLDMSTVAWRSRKPRKGPRGLKSLRLGSQDGKTKQDLTP